MCDILATHGILLARMRGFGQCVTCADIILSKHIRRKLINKECSEVAEQASVVVQTFNSKALSGDGEIRLHFH